LASLADDNNRELFVDLGEGEGDKLIALLTGIAHSHDMKGAG